MTSPPGHPGHRSSGALKILIVASLRYPLAEPFAGGLEVHTAALAEGLRQRGHSVVLAGAAGSDPTIVDHVFGALPRQAPGERADIMENDAVREAEKAGFAAISNDLQSGFLGTFDVVHNNSLYPLLVEEAHLLPCPLVTTLHTPPLPWAARVLGGDRRRTGSFVAVSRSTATAWQHLITPSVVLNGIDTSRWRLGPGGQDAVWSGRLVAEKAPHLAIDIARAAGIGLAIAGPIVDPAYFQRRIAPELDDRIRYAGHLDRRRLATLVGDSTVALVTPAWDEPFGLVAAEAMACGTPVVAFARGGLPEILSAVSGRLLAPPVSGRLDRTEMQAATAAVAEAVRLDRARVRAETLDRFSLAAMLTGYEYVYFDAVDEWNQL